MTPSLLYFVYIGNAEVQDDLPWTGRLYTCEESALSAARDLAWKSGADITVVSVAAFKDEPPKPIHPVPTAVSFRVVTYSSAKEHYKDRTRGLKYVGR